MLECLTEWMTPALYVWHGAGRVVQRAGVRHNMIVPYGAYACADGDVMFAIQTDREWRRFCSVVMQSPTLADDPRVRRLTRAASQIAVGLEAMIEARFRSYSRADVIALLEEADIANRCRERRPRRRGAITQLAVARQRWAQVESPGGDIPALMPPHNLRERSVANGTRPLTRPAHRRRSRRDGASHDVRAHPARSARSMLFVPRPAGP